MKKKKRNTIAFDLESELQRRIEVLAKCLVDLAEENIELRKKINRQSEGDEKEDILGEKEIDDEEEEEGDEENTESPNNTTSNNSNGNDGEKKKTLKEEESWVDISSSSRSAVPILSYNAKRRMVTIGKHKLELEKENNTITDGTKGTTKKERQRERGNTVRVVSSHPLLPHSDDDNNNIDIFPSANSTPSSFIISSSGYSLSSSPTVVSDDDDDDDLAKSDEEEEVAPVTTPGQITLLGGETILLKVDALRVHLDPDSILTDSGLFYVTNFRLAFVSLSGGPKIEFALTSLSNLTKVGGNRRNAEPTSYRLDIESKYMRPTLRLSFSRNTSSSTGPSLRSRVHKLLLACGPNQPSRFMFAFNYHGNESSYKGEWGWSFIDPMSDLSRLLSLSSSSSPSPSPPPPPSSSSSPSLLRSSQSISPHSSVALSSPAWRITYINKDYNICDTYPRIFAVPANITDADLKAAATHRRRGRVPALSWIHPINKASITRCSQPLSGVSRSHSPEDVKLVTSILASTPGATELLIMDARPLVNARANVVMGAGYEHVAKYTNCKLDFMGIPNIHVVRDSWMKLKELLTDETKKFDDNRWRTSLENTSWLQYIGLILSASVKLADAVENGVSVLCHCSDGWDRTSQLVALAQLMLDPTYRTIKGFCNLVERQWIDFGHKFAHRHGHAGKSSLSSLSSSNSPSSSSLSSSSSSLSSSNSSSLSSSFNPKNSKSSLPPSSLPLSSSVAAAALESDLNPNTSEWSPIFVQFLDCVWQMTRQFPCSFEFNDAFLQIVADESYACRFGTFLANCRREQQTMRLPDTTTSLWTYIALQQDEFTNPLYTTEGAERYLKVSSLQQTIHVWPYYTHHVLALPAHPSIQSHVRSADLVKKAKAAMDRSQTLESELTSCTKRLMELLTSDDPTPSSLSSSLSSSSSSHSSIHHKKLFADFEVG